MFGEGNKILLGGGGVYLGGIFPVGGGEKIFGWWGGLTSIPLVGKTLLLLLCYWVVILLLLFCLSKLVIKILKCN